MDINDCNPTFFIDIPAGGASSQHQVFRSQKWACHVSIPPSADEHDVNITISLYHQTSTNHYQYDNQTVLDCTRLRILSGPLNSAGFLVLEMPFRLPQVLLYGLQAQIDPSMVNFGSRYIFRALIEGGDVHGYSYNQQQSRSAQPLDFRIASSLSTSQVSMEVKHRMTELLERAVNADVQLSFCSPSASPRPRPTSGHGYDDDVRSVQSLNNDSTLKTHLCVLKTVGTVPMKRLLNTCSPNIQSRPSNSSVHVEHSGGDINAMEPIREIRFEDSPPAAVEAVVRYIYLGQQPVLEPLCGYTVKDLMSLASYLEIERLQDHCVELVLGMSTGCDSEGDRRSSNRSSRGTCGRVEQPSSRNEERRHRLPYRRAVGQQQQQQQQRQQQQPQRRQPQRHRRYRKKSRIGAETAVQILFGWGYRFPKIRQGLIRALVDDHGYGFADGKLMGLERFRDHQEYNAVVFELAIEQFNWIERDHA